MFRALIYGLAILHLGPAMAFGVLAFGCDPGLQLLGSACQKDALQAFLGLTVTFWLMLGAGALALRAMRRPGGRTAARRSASRWPTTASPARAVARERLTHPGETQAHQENE